MLLNQITNSPPVAAAPDTTVIQAVRLMAEHDVGSIIVTDPAGKVIGIFTERDNMLRVTLKNRDPYTTLLQDVMTVSVATASPELPVNDALEQMLRSRHRHLPTVDKSGKLLGVVSVRHLLMKRLDEQHDDIETLVAYANSGGPG